jgi:hypothetical protein
MLSQREGGGKQFRMCYNLGVIHQKLEFYGENVES